VIKVTLCIPTLDRSGAEKQLTLLACGLPRDEFNVQVIALTRGGAYESVLRDSGIPQTVLHKRFKFDPLALWKLRRLISDLRPDIFHTWLFTANAYGRLATGKRPRSTVIVSERCVDTWKSGWQHWLDRKQVSRTTRLVANSQSVAEFYRQKGFPADRIIVIPNGVAIPDTSDVQREHVLARLDIPADAVIIGFVGRLARQKRIDDLIWAMELLKQLNERTYFLIIGDGPECERLIRFTRDIRRENCIRFAGHRDDVPELLKIMDVFWLASDFEGQSNSVMEAMVAGIPVVASDIPPNRELIIDGETGYLVKLGDRAAFAQATNRLLADRSLLQRMGTASRQRMRAEFSVEKMVNAHAALYREVVAGSQTALSSKGTVAN